jgi:large subunit ribosomal protein L30
MQAVVKLRGEANIRETVDDTLAMLNVHARNHCTLVPETPAYEGMLTKVNDYVAFGEPSAGVLATLLRRRAEPLAGDADVDDDWIDANTAYVDADALAEALLDEETTLRDAGLSPSLRLHPPRGGHDGVKRAVVEGGELGRHDTEAMDALLEAMR